LQRKNPLAERKGRQKKTAYRPVKSTVSRGVYGKKTESRKASGKKEGGKHYARTAYQEEFEDSVQMVTCKNLGGDLILPT